MAETTTPHFAWVKPDIGGDASTWGNVLNQTIDAIDSVVYANRQAGVPIGSITMFGGGTSPANWLICDGRSLDTTAYAALFAVLQYVHGGSGTSFNLPNLQTRFPLGAGSNPLGQSAGSFSVPIATANLPPHNHPASQDAHNHGITTGSHSHTLSTGGHSHAIHTGAHNHTVNNTIATSGSGLTNGGASWSLGTQTTSTAGDLGGSTDAVGNLGGATDTAGNLGGSTDGRQPNVYTSNTGSGTPLSVTPPFIALNFIIRFM